VPLTRRLARAAAAALAAAHAGPALADCQVSVNLVAFGIVELDRQSTGTGRVVVSCDAATSFEVAIAGEGGGARRMSGPDGGRLAYDLYQDAAHAVRWGDGRGSGAARPGNAAADAAANLTIYGVVPRQNGVPAGVYFDQLQVTLSF
jgi:spore coat protein U-like protein